MQKAKELVAAVRQRKARRAQEKLLREPSRLWREGRLARSQSAAKEEAERRFLAVRNAGCICNRLEPW